MYLSVSGVRAPWRKTTDTCLRVRLRGNWVSPSGWAFSLTRVWSRAAADVVIEVAIATADGTIHRRIVCVVFGVFQRLPLATTTAYTLWILDLKHEKVR